MSGRKRKKTTDEQWFCDLSVGIDSSGISPVIKMCHKPAKLYKFKEIFGEVALCEEHKDWKPRNYRA